MAVRGLQLRGPEAALERSCRELKVEQARTRHVALLACGAVVPCLENNGTHGRTDVTRTLPIHSLCVLCRSYTVSVACGRPRHHGRRLRRARHIAAECLDALQTFKVRGAARDAAYPGHRVFSRPLRSGDVNFEALKWLQSGAMRDEPYVRIVR
jgi:hypothetical protein